MLQARPPRRRTLNASRARQRADAGAGRAAVEAQPQPAGYTFFKPQEALFIEAVVDHMVPKDELTPSGTDIGIATYIDRALAGSWGKGDRLYMQGPWQRGTANQGYQLPLTPAALYRAGIEGANAHCRKAFGQTFDRCTAEQKETFLRDSPAARSRSQGGLPGRAFFAALYQNVMEGMFADPIYGGNRDKVCWKMIGFPGVIGQQRREHQDSTTTDGASPPIPSASPTCPEGGTHGNQTSSRRHRHRRHGLDRRHPRQGARARPD